MCMVNVDGVLINIWSKLKKIASLFLDSFMCYHNTSTDMRPQNLPWHVIEKSFFDGVNLDWKSKQPWLYTYISLHVPLHVEKIKEHVNEGDPSK